MDGSLDLIQLPSTNSALFMDAHIKIQLSSTKSALFMDGKFKILLPSTKFAFFMDGSPDLASWCTLAPPFRVGSAGFTQTSHVYLSISVPGIQILYRFIVLR